VITACSPAVVSLSSFHASDVGNTANGQSRWDEFSTRQLPLRSLLAPPILAQAAMERSLTNQGSSIVVMRGEGPEKVMATQ
jgi:hypothetical protein